MKNNNCAVIVSSFDGYSDIWDPFFQLFFRYWSDCPFPIYLITNELEYPNPRVLSFKIGKDKGWSSNLINILNKIDCKYIIYLQEDYFLNDKVKNKEIINALHIAEKENVAYVRLSPKKEAIQWKNYESIKLIPKDTSYLNSTQAAIWNKEALLSILREGETGWEFELKGGIERARKLTEPFFVFERKHIIVLCYSNS
jgi:hypothetical protein